MEKALHSSNFFDLFGLNNDLNFIAIFNIKIYEDFYPEGFVFEKATKYSGFWIGKMVDEIPLFYMIDFNTIDLKNFVPYGQATKISLNCKPEKVLYRYGKKRWIEKALEGSFLIKPAIYYSEDDNNQARKDNEHIFESKIKKELNPIVKTLQGQTIEVIGDISQTFTDRDINQYILCMSYAYDERLYDAFESDACLVIKDVIEFEKRLESAIVSLNRGFYFVGNRVSYSKIMHQLSILFSKTFNYIAQREYRYLIYSDNPISVNYERIQNYDANYFQDKIEPLKIELGNLKDIAEVVYKS